MKKHIELNGNCGRNLIHALFQPASQTQHASHVCNNAWACAKATVGGMEYPNHVELDDMIHQMCVYAYCVYTYSKYAYTHVAKFYVCVGDTCLGTDAVNMLAKAW